jgi:hypothetical protein
MRLRCIAWHRVTIEGYVIGYRGKTATRLFALSEKLNKKDGKLFMTKT